MESYQAADCLHHVDTDRQKTVDTMKITLRLTLYTSKPYADGSHPIILRYTIDRKVKKKVLYRCHLKDWDFKTDRVKSKSPNAAYINNMLSERFNEAERELFEVQKGEKHLSDLFDSEKQLTLRECFDLELIRLEREFKSGYYDKILSLRKQVDESVIVDNIDESWLNDMSYKLAKLGNIGNTIKKKIKVIRGIISEYSKKGVTKEVKDYKVATTKTIKQKLTDQELSTFKNLQLAPDSLLDVCRDIFLLQIYLRGIRIGDILQCKSSDFVNGRFSYRSNKTDEPYNIKLIPSAISIVEKYYDRYPCLFPLFTWKYDKKIDKFQNLRDRLKHKEICTSVVNAQLKVLALMAGIKKPLSSHIARHTFSRMAINKINNPMITMELLGHSSLSIHQEYLNDIRKDDELDKAADDIFG